MSKYTSVFGSVSTCVPTVAIGCIMHVCYVRRILMMSDIALINAELSLRFSGSRRK